MALPVSPGRALALKWPGANASVRPEPPSRMIRSISPPFAVIIITIITQTDSIATTTLTFTQQVLNTIHNIGFYLWRMFVPLDLSPFYPYPPLEEIGSFSHWLPALIAILGFSAASFVMATRGNPVPLCCWLIYLVTLSPVSGIIPVGSAIVADRYSYLTLLPIIVLMSIALVNLFQIFPRFRSITFSLVLFSLIALGTLTHAQVSHWKNPITLWTHVLKLYPDAALAHKNISAAYNLIGYHENALGHLEYISEQGWDVDKQLAGTLALVNQIPRSLALYVKMVLSDKYTEVEIEAFKLEIERLQRADH